MPSVPKPEPRKKKSRRPLPRGGPPKVRNVKRHQSEWARAYGSKERVAWVKALTCVVHGSHVSLCPLCHGPTENAHTEGGGSGRKADARTIIPLCQMHHRSLHTIGRLAFEARHYIDLGALAAETESEWQTLQASNRNQH